MHITETVRVAAEAWHKIKPAEDPDFNNCALSHREHLIAKIERFAATGGASDDFEKAAKEIMDLQLKAPEAAPAKAAKASKSAKASKPAKGGAKKVARK